MASVSRDGKGWRILFVASDGKRKTLRLGRVDKKTAESIRSHVEHLLVARTTGQPLVQATAAWLNTIGEQLKEKLARAGLIEAPRRIKLAAYLEDFVKSRQTTHKPASLVVWKLVVGDLIKFFGQDCRLDSILPQHAEAFHQWLISRNLRATTISKRLQHARMFFNHAKRQGLMGTNPFELVRHRAGDPSERRAYISVPDALKVIDVCPNVWWRLLVALARFGGLRIPSEAFSLRWGDVDWERGRLVVPSPKTEGHGKAYRIIPIFKSLRPYLEEAWDAAQEGDEYVFPWDYRRRAQGPGGWANANLRTTLTKVIRRAGLEPWPRLWHNLRASCESDLAQAFPLATVAKWLGNTPSIALRHYVDPTDAAYTQALNWSPPIYPQEDGGTKSGAPVAQNATQQAPASTGKIEKTASQPLSGSEVVQRGASHNFCLQRNLVERRGFEPPTSRVRF